MNFDTTPLTKDFTPTGLKLEGPYENDRNTVYSELYKAIIREAYGVKDVICAHHLVYVVVEHGADGFEYQRVQEVPSADTLIFDHDVAKKIWGPMYRSYLVALACEPIATRDALLARFYYSRPNSPPNNEPFDVMATINPDYADSFERNRP